MKSFPLFALMSVVVLSSVPAWAQSSEHLEGLKANMAASKAILRHEQWIETTTVSVNGDVKSTEQQECYYGDDGSLQKIELSDDKAQQRNGLLFRRLKERKKEEMTDFMKEAVALVKSYVPPSVSKIEAAKEAGTISMTLLEGKKARLTIKNYQLPGDTYTIDISLATNRPLRLHVSTYVDDPSQPVTMTVSMGQLNSGATYAEDTTLEAPSKNLTVTVHNGGFRSK